MTKEEYIKRKKIINEAYKRDILVLDNWYAILNNNNKIGDVVQDHVGYGKVIAIEVCFTGFDKYPVCKYKCLELKKNKEPRKDGSIRWIYQNNLK